MLSVSTEHDNVEFARRLEAATRRRFEDSASRGFAISQDRVPVDRGTLLQSGFPPRWVDGELVWGYAADHARTQEFGRDPYQPRLEPLLEWSRRVTGGEELGRYVALEKHPTEGMEGHGYAQAGADAQQRYLEQYRLGEYLEDVD